MASLTLPAAATSAYPLPFGHRALRWSAATWLLVAVLGQVFFLAYVSRLYGSAALSGDLLGWNKVMPRGYVPGDGPGNVALGSHLLLAVAVLLGGSLQLLPALRRAAPRVHHWVGRSYIAAAVVMSLTGLYMVWVRGGIGGLGQHLGISLNALLILAFAGLALRAAMARRFDEHRRWALRLYLAVLGVWFFRLGLTLWLLIHRAPVGFDPATFSGPFLTFLSFAQTLVPLAFLQLYFRAQRSASPGVQGAAAGALALLTLATAAGTGTAYLMLWQRHY
jgi:hypothetical protein